jgi:hypothetical protein
MKDKSRAITSLSDGRLLIEKTYKTAKELLFYIREAHCLSYRFAGYGITFFVKDEETERSEVWEEGEKEDKSWEDFRSTRIEQLNNAEELIERKKAEFLDHFAKIEELFKFSYSVLGSFKLPPRGETASQDRQFRSLKSYLLIESDNASAVIFMSRGNFKSPRHVSFEVRRLLMLSSDEIAKRNLPLGEEDFVITRSDQEESQLLRDLPNFLKLNGIEVDTSPKTTPKTRELSSKQKEDKEDRQLVFKAWLAWKDAMEKQSPGKRLFVKQWRNAWDQTKPKAINIKAQDAFDRLAIEELAKRHSIDDEIELLNKIIRAAGKTNRNEAKRQRQ